ncbi:hypothetical protein Moror_6211 [Moniliophthora roreri MCA 2997]|uniref:Uncharacterized protein n=1 Tax=Moniliophthora roreri (strain MCA 2997) TaxID=1381753 RepID=V2WSA0_MONRO|nr:hypothetical protein Moror_6211 [Moniliophthora roreri MCA 2997]
MFSRAFVLISLVAATVAAPAAIFVRRQLPGQVLTEFRNGGIPGNGSTAAENGICGRLDATIFAPDASGIILNTTKSWLAPVGFCEECDEGSVILNSKAFAELGGDPTVGVIPNVYPRFG